MMAARAARERSKRLPLAGLRPWSQQGRERQLHGDGGAEPAGIVLQSAATFRTAGRRRRGP